METYVFSDKDGLPDAFVVIESPAFHGLNFFALMDGEELN